jgi:hypothetical protein
MILQSINAASLSGILAFIRIYLKYFVYNLYIAYINVTYLSLPKKVARDRNFLADGGVYLALRDTVQATYGERTLRASSRGFLKNTLR